MSEDGASYRAAGVDYDALDAGKRLAMAKALSTSPLLAGRGGRGGRRLREREAGRNEEGCGKGGLLHVFLAPLARRGRHPTEENQNSVR